MKVLLYDDLFYYTIVMHTDMQELMWAAECIHSVLSAIIRDDRLDLIQPIVSSACREDKKWGNSFLKTEVSHQDYRSIQHVDQRL